MADKITAEFHQLTEDAGRCASGWLSDAERCIDGQFGEGFAKEHPQLVGDFLKAAATAHGLVVVAQQLREACDDLGHRLWEAARQV
jgi:hypothetical protein